MGTKIPADRIYHTDKVLAGVPQLLDDFHKLIDDQESGEIWSFNRLLCCQTHLKSL